MLIVETFIIKSFIILGVEAPFQKADLQGDVTFKIKMNLLSLHWPYSYILTDYLLVLVSIIST